MKKLILLFAVALIGQSASAAPTVIKFATVAPEGTTWMEVLKAANAEIRSKTASRVEFKFYPGGIAGDEPDVIRKMRVGQYQGAGFTGVGLGEILPTVRILELPLFCRNLEEIDYLKEKLTPELSLKFRAKGFEFLGWAEPGLVYLFTQKPVRGPADLKGMKLWAWEGDPLAGALINAFKVSPVFIALPDVLMALQTGMLNAVYAPPLAALSLQWQTKVKFMLSEPLTNSTGAALVTKKVWDQISPADQAIVHQVFTKALANLTTATRQQNNDAIGKFKQMGIKVEQLTPEGREELAKAAAEIRPQLIGKLYTADELKKAENLLSDYRKKKGGK